MASLEIKRQINAPVNQVFAAWSDPSQMGQWLFSGNKMTCEVTNDFRVGGDYQVVMTHLEDGNVHTHRGTYKGIELDKKIIFTWKNHLVTDTLVTVTFQAEEKGTLMTLKHDFFENEEVKAMHNQGWTGCLVNLLIYMEKVSAA